MEERINKSRMKEEKKKNKFRKTEIAAGKNEPIKNQSGREGHQKERKKWKNN